MSGSVAEKEARKRQLEEEIRAKPPKIKEAAVEAEKEGLKGEIVKIGAEKMAEEKKTEVREQKERIAEPSLKAEISHARPEQSLALDEEAKRIKAGEHSLPEEVRRDEFRLGTKAAEMDERSLSERVGKEERLKDEKFEQTRKGPATGGKKQAAPEGRRIKRPPTAEEMEREEAKVHKLEMLRRKERIRQKLEAERMERLPKSLATKVWLRLGSIGNKIKNMFNKVKLR